MEYQEACMEYQEAKMDFAKMDKLESELKKWLTNKFKGERKEKNKIRVPISHIWEIPGGGPTAPGVGGGGKPWVPGGISQNKSNRYSNLDFFSFTVLFNTWLFFIISLK